MEASTEKLIFKIWSSDRKEKKIINSEPTIEKVIETARKKGLTGFKVVVEEDGSEIDEDELLKYFAEKPLILLKENEEWQPLTSMNTTLPEAEKIIYVDSANNNNTNEKFVLMNLPTSNFGLPKDVEISSVSSLPSTLSMTSGVLSTDESEQENSFLSSSIKANFDNFTIPWEKFPKSIMDQCENGQKIGANLKTIIHIIVEELRTVSYYIPVRVFRDITSKLVARYPRTFMYTDMEGKQITIKNSPLIASFIQRNNYLNRPTCSKKSNPNIPLKKKRMSKNFEDTCVNWQGNSNDKDEEQDMTSHKLKLLEFNLKRTWTKEEFNEIIKLMDLCYSVQRKFLNDFLNTPSLKEIKENWPFLLHKFFVYKHFSKLTEIEVNKVLDNFDGKISKIINYGQKNKSQIMAEILKKTNNNEAFIALQFITRYFNEDMNFLFKAYPIGTVNTDIKPPGPCVWFCSVETGTGDIFYIYADNELVTSQAESFKEAFVQTFCLYFMLNVQYPMEASQSFEFLQRFIFELYTEGSRGKKKNLTAMAKVVRFVQNIQQHHF